VWDCFGSLFLGGLGWREVLVRDALVFPPVVLILMSLNL
jgi:hypothetical protein